MDKPYILGLDLGETSIGVAVVDCELNKFKREELDEKTEELKEIVYEVAEPINLRDLGVRIFPDGRNDTNKEPLNVTRRDARGIRRNNERKRARKKKLLNFLKGIGFETPNYKKQKPKSPYDLRVKALDERLEKDELAQVILHICQRRGFLSNRKNLKKDKDGTYLKKELKNTKEKIVSANCRTLGEWIYKTFDRNGNKKRVAIIESKEIVRDNNGEIKRNEQGDERTKKVKEYNYFPSRELLQSELELILKKQCAFYPELSKHIIYARYDFINKEYKKEKIAPTDVIKYIIFTQRELKPQEVGKCIFEHDECRISKASPYFQYFRILQEVNNLKYNYDKPLTLEQRSKIIGLLQKQKSLKFSKIRKEFKIEGKFNLESEKRDGLDGNTTSCEMRKYVGNWDELDLKTQNEYVMKIIDAKTDDEILDYFNVQPQVESCPLCEIKLDGDDKYGNLSQKAIEKILPYLREGKLYYEAVVLAGYEKHSNFEADKRNLLPYYGEILHRSCIGGTQDPKDCPIKRFGKITNVTVHKGLNQIRECINEIIAKYGMPNAIHLELARTLNMSQARKKELIREQEKKQEHNEEIKKKLREGGIEVNGANIEKYKLWERMDSNPLKRCCPFCGKNITSIVDLFSPLFEIEHILPFSRTYDNSKNNKIISCAKCNREKGDRTPFETWGVDGKKYSEILERAKKLGEYEYNGEKRSPFEWRFKEDAMEKWKNKNKTLDRMIVDTQYLSKATREYLTALLPSEKIIVNPGRMTSMIREWWGLNAILDRREDDESIEDGEEKKKDRTMHYHHAVDAFVVACINRKNIQRLATIAGARYESIKASDNREVIEQANISKIPYKDFSHEIVKEKINSLIISFKQTNKKIEKGKSTGYLHRDSFYGKFVERLKDKNGNEIEKNVYTITKPLSKDFKDFDKIADKTVRMELNKLGSSEIMRQMAENGYVKLSWVSKKGKNCCMKIKSVRIHECNMNSLVKIANYEK
ncbi:MAG: type II CRISPR RNA-guided endonuclease Cas9, partial [Rickettsiales bacterium]|nr:type II CRISPR RNA-guided endonuclease Cas9 [Rickettsiales bacterium]